MKLFQNKCRKWLINNDHIFVHSINLDAIATLEARRQQIEAKYHDIYQPDDDRSECSWYWKKK